MVFDRADPEDIDNVGTAFELDPDGKTIMIKEPGLYSLTWSLNLAGGAQPLVFGTVEGGFNGSAHAASSQGSFSSGALICVGEDETPYTVSLRNFGASAALDAPQYYEGVAASLRIFKFAQGPEV